MKMIPTLRPLVLPPRRLVVEVIDHEPVVGTGESVRIVKELGGALVRAGEVRVSPLIAAGVV